MGMLRHESWQLGMTSESAKPSGGLCNYFVDEAGDAILFNQRKQVVIGIPGCSCYFILGKLSIPDPASLGSDLQVLRAELLSDPYFRSVPSMQPEAGKTAVAFHAKDDLPEVRREVFKILMRHPMSFFAEVRHKRAVLTFVRQQNDRNPHYRYNENELYDSLVSRLFKNRLHKDAAYLIHFAKRGSRDRTAALLAALEKARRNFQRTWGTSTQAALQVVPTVPRHSPGLQAVDYFLWALQRHYERDEDRFLELVWPWVSLIHDIDDLRTADYGVYYTNQRPLSIAVRKKEAGDIGPIGKNRPATRPGADFHPPASNHDIDH